MRRLASCVLALALVGTALPTGRADAAGSGRSSSEQLFAIAFSRIADTYLEPVEMRRLTLDGLNNLKALEPDLTLTAGDNALSLRVGRTPVGELALPRGNDPVQWAQVAAKALERLRAASPQLGRSTRDQLHQTVFDGVIADLDAYSRYTNATRATDERSQREGFGGVGLALRHEGGRHVIESVVRDGPAERAGVSAGDDLLAIDGEYTQAWGSEDIAQRLRGQAGSLVMLTVGRSLDESRRVGVRRDWIVPNTVSAESLDGVGVLKVDRFNASTAGNLRQAADELRAALGADARGYILDLRGNPGGKLDQAVAVADLFIRQGRIISTRGRHPESMQQFDAKPDDILEGKPLVVLVDGRSASAAEIVAAALQDSGRAVVVGASSFGKGSVQTVTRMPNDGELFLTWSRIYAPSGYTLHRQGVQPSICTSNDVKSPEDALSTLKGAGPVPPSTLANWRMRAPEDATALAELRQACPWKEHEPALDVEIARALLANRPLYSKALALSGTNLAQR